MDIFDNTMTVVPIMPGNTTIEVHYGDGYGNTSVATFDVNVLSM